MHRDVTALVRPRTVVIVGASSKRSSQGNVVIQNLQNWKFQGRILPVHPSAAEIDGLAVLNSYEALPDAVDTAIVAVPAAEVVETLRQLALAGVRSANVFSNGFSTEQEAAMRTFGAQTPMSINGPNCMGLVNFTDAAPLYPSRPSLRLQPGRVALVAQSGSAAISVMNTITTGLSKVITVGSEFQVTAADYLAWLANDEATTVVGVVAESIQDPVAFAHAAEMLHAAGKPLVVLKVGNSDMGAAATRAHTGALISSRDAMDSFLRACDIATARDYDELVASLECAVTAPRMTRGGRIAVAGISGGQTALACDVAAWAGIALAEFSEATRAGVRAGLPGTPGQNPVDIGATVQQSARNTPVALGAVLADPGVGALALLQDAQASLNPRTYENYMLHIPGYGALGRSTDKPVVMISPTGEGLHAGIQEALAGTGVPVLRGLREGLVAIDNLRRGQPGRAGAWAQAHRANQPLRNPEAAQWRRLLADTTGSVAPELCLRILRSYGVPVVKSLVAASADEILARADEVGFPMVVKVASREISHRSDVGGVVLGVVDAPALRAALETIGRNVARAAPLAHIDGFEIQQQMAGDAEAVVGFAAAAPLGTLMVVGTGGTLVELVADRAVELAPLSPQQAVEMLQQTRLGKLLEGYRNLLPRTDLGPLAGVLHALSNLAMDLGDLIDACDLNPVLVSKGTGAVCVVDALLIARGAG
ncbi:MAG: acetate--CoA ligase family protein [Rhodoferax sp.]|nr:acetate--CoA ligase family protein [Rhodoferax sp.]MBP9928483.1 acetate--CoA ligase family protein [Rhodoferax sp.]HQZ06263.1 acetate--CoA ligase family protein [Burkholderiaceae bacterium]HRA61848.1 acetate--CoA ligase family protein [Burkholderiaceae bacterium]